jgi:prepilin signal peptidase PulO-like enzyme (type II secretory pathway)
LSPETVAIVSAGSFAFGVVLGIGLAAAIEKVPERPPDFRRSHPRARLAAVMAVTGVGFLLAFLRFGLVWRLPLAWFFIAVMIVIAFIDWDLMIIPNKIVLPAAVIGLGASIALDPDRWWVYVVAAVGAALFLFILALIWPGGMGMGDVKLALFMGAVLGSMVIAAMFLAFLFGAIVGLILIASKLKTRKDAIPFGPYLALGSVLALLYGDWMLGAYLGLLG